MSRNERFETDWAAIVDRIDREGYPARIKSLSAAENNGESALVVDPIESPLWYVDLPREFLEYELPEEAERLHLLAAWTIDFANQNL